MEKFKVYKGTSAAAYSGGCLLIAARNLDEANQFLTEEPSAFSQFGDEPKVILCEIYAE